MFHIVELASAKPAAAVSASQTLARGLDVLEQVATGGNALGVIAARLGLSRTTVHRLASSLVERRYLNLTPRRGYSLGPKLLELGSLAGEQIALLRAASPIMEGLAEETGDAVLLSVRDGAACVTAGCMSGRRRLAPRLRVGERQDLWRSAAGLALLLDEDEAGLARLGKREGTGALQARLREAAESGLVLDANADDGEIATMSAPIRGADGRIVAALGVAMASPYRAEGMADGARDALLRAGAALSAELGWRIAKAHDGARAQGAARELLGQDQRPRSAPPEGRGRRRGKTADAATTIG